MTGQRRVRSARLRVSPPATGCGPAGASRRRAHPRDLHTNVKKGEEQHSFQRDGLVSARRDEHGRHPPPTNSRSSARSRCTASARRVVRSSARDQGRRPGRVAASTTEYATRPTINRAVRPRTSVSESRCQDCEGGVQGAPDTVGRASANKAARSPGDPATLQPRSTGDGSSPAPETSQPLSFGYG